MKHEERVLERPGARLRYDVYLPQDEPTAVIHVAHGLAEHAARYRRLAEALTEVGWAVYVPDQRGHGRSAEGDDGLGFFAETDGWSTVVGDLRAFVELEHDAHPGAGVAVVGHSMGSLILQDYLSRYRGGELACAALSGTSGPPPPIAAAGRVVARLERLRQGKRGRSTLIDKLAFGAYNKPFEPARTGFDWLSRDEKEVDAYVADRWCGFRATNQLWIDVLDALPGLSRPERLSQIPKELPIFLFSGAADPVGDNGKGVEELARRYRSAGLTEVRLKLYSEGRHELLNETNRDEVTQDLVEWLRTHLG